METLFVEKGRISGFKLQGSGFETVKEIKAEKEGRSTLAQLHPTKEIEAKGRRQLILNKKKGERSRKTLKGTRKLAKANLRPVASRGSSAKTQKKGFLEK